MRIRGIRVIRGFFFLVLSFLLASCRQDMAEQPRYNPLAASDFFGDRRSARPLVPGTVARGHLNDNDAFYTGRVNKTLVTALPFPPTRDVLERGRQRFDIFCAPCHDRTGNGNGIVPQRGLKHPPSFHIERLRQVSVGYFFDAITNGFGAMPSYSERIPARDRWTIVAYVRALQLSQHATIENVPPSERDKLMRQEVRP